MKPVLMIHKVSDELFNLPLEDYTLTFDDGLYSQYSYLSKFLEIETDKIFFISTGIICTGHQSTEFPESDVAHSKAFIGNFEDFMTLDQIKEIAASNRCYIGAHSHSHTRLNNFDRIVDKMAHIKQDTELLLKWFQDNLDRVPDSFCYPYNEDLGKLYTAILKQYGFKYFYGNERISVEKLLLQRSQPVCL
jgi:peptidoglycan/xylan/chitin deacetylase (PgdA/CDA1 family)